MVSVGTPEDQAIFWEVHISNLRHAINISESCINCSCMYRDELSIGMGISWLFYHAAPLTPYFLRLSRWSRGYIVSDSNTPSWSCNSG